jgi:histidine ammonia-lyase
MKFEPQVKLTIDDLEDALSSESRFVLSPRAKQRLHKISLRMQKKALSPEAIYGVNTGFGRLAQIRIQTKDLVKLQVNLVRSHASGIGEPCPASVVRRLLFLRALSLGKGPSGISPLLVQRHLDYLNQDLIPVIPQEGSVGASGDLAPLAHLALTFLGEGSFMVKGKVQSASSVLNRARLKPLTLGAKEGLALVNGTQFSLAWALEALAQTQEAVSWMLEASLLSIEGHRATRAVFDPRLHALKEHPHQRAVADFYWKALAGSPHMSSHNGCDLVQDSYSFRCIPQVVGPAMALLDQAQDLLTDELNSVSDNPVYLAESDELLSGGHFHAHAVSMAADLMSLSLATLINLTERRIDQLVNPLTTRTKAFLANDPGTESGMMIVQTAAAALASQSQALVHPASAHSIPTNGNQEDHVSMAPWAAHKALKLAQNLKRVAAAEFLVGIRACELEREISASRFAPRVETHLRGLKSALPQLFQKGDFVFGDAWAALENYLEKGGLA